MNPAFAAVLPVFAGGLILVSMCPEIASNLRDPRRALNQSLKRAALQVLGHTLWVTYGLVTGDWKLACVTGLALVLGGCLLIQTLRARASRCPLSRGE